jgi:hypothetical protein
MMFDVMKKQAMLIPHPSDGTVQNAYLALLDSAIKKVTI